MPRIHSVDPATTGAAAEHVVHNAFTYHLSNVAGTEIEFPHVSLARVA